MEPSSGSGQVRAGELYAFTHAGGEWRAGLEARFGAILAAMDDAAARQGE